MKPPIRFANLNAEDLGAWPVPDGAFDEIQWAHRYGDPGSHDRMLAATVMSDYALLVQLPRSKRERIVAAIRKELLVSRVERDKEP